MPNPHTPRRAPRSVRVGVLLALLVALTALGAHAQAAHGGAGLVLTFSATPDPAIAVYDIDAGVPDDDRAAITEGVNAAAQYQDLLLGGHPAAPLIVEIRRDASCGPGDPTGDYVSGRGICVSVGNAHWPAAHWQRVEVAAHEYFHAWQDATGCLKPPRWLTEGMAEYLGQRVALASGEVNAAELDARMRQAVAGDAALPNLELLTDVAPLPPTAYAAGALAIEQLVARHGLHSLRAFCVAEAEADATPSGWQRAFTRAFGQTTADFYAAFAAERASFGSASATADTSAPGAPTTSADADAPLPSLDPLQTPNFTWTYTLSGNGTGTPTTTETIEQAAPDSYHLVRSLGGRVVSELWQQGGTRYARMGNGNAVSVVNANDILNRVTPATLIASARPVYAADADISVVGTESIDGHAATHYHAARVLPPPLTQAGASATPEPSTSGTLEYWIDDASGLVLRETGTFTLRGPAGQIMTITAEISLSHVGTTAPVAAPAAPETTLTPSGLPTSTAMAGDRVPLVNPAAVPNFTWTMTLRTVVSPGHAAPVTLTIEQFAPDNYHVVEALNGVAISEVWRVAGVTIAELSGKPLPANAGVPPASPAARLADGPSLRRDTATRVGAETLDGRAATHYRDTAASLLAVLGHAESMPPSVSADAPTGTLDFWVDDATGMLLKAEGTFNATGPSGRTNTVIFSAALTAIGTTAQVVPPSE